MSRTHYLSDCFVKLRAYSLLLEQKWPPGIWFACLSPSDGLCCMDLLLSGAAAPFEASLSSALACNLKDCMGTGGVS